MDSMRSLNSSLPSSTRPRSTPPEELLQAFRTAALSVTNLYKSAATNQASARQVGYQEALEDLLKFLDKENLGLQDGEGWKVRQWATARYEGSPSQYEDDEVEEEHPEVASRSRGPSQEREDTLPNHEQSEETASSPRQEPGEPDQASVFHFSANNPTENNMQTDEPSSPPPPTEEPSSSSPPIRVEVLNRNNRSNSRPLAPRHSIRSNLRDFTFTAGTKRKLQFPDFFDISNLNDKRDSSGGGGGSKRGRFV